ncbi:hypothetical protein GJ496_001673 [Pomphorhynchus laevis]|nr:hypothetical protein GJ496_001672 [Pomphorhynchus laevis]KAI0987363.1 hypothetical protein GJ496_001673 [Pomphorhynchus laevis]
MISCNCQTERSSHTEPKHRIPLTLCTRDLPFFVKAYGREQVARIPEIIDLFVDCVFKLSLKFPFDFVSS